MSEKVFFAYSKRFFTAKLSAVFPYYLLRANARSIRVLWHLQNMGGGFVSIYHLRQIGAGQWKGVAYAIHDLLTDNLICEVRLTRKSGKPYFRYGITPAGKRLLTALEEYLAEEYNKAIARCDAFKKDLPYSKKNFDKHRKGRA